MYHGPSTIQSSIVHHPSPITHHPSSILEGQPNTNLKPTRTNRACHRWSRPMADTDMPVPGWRSTQRIVRQPRFVASTYLNILLRHDCSVRPTTLSRLSAPYYTRRNQKKNKQRVRLASPPPPAPEQAHKQASSIRTAASRHPPPLPPCRVSLPMGNVEERGAPHNTSPATM